MNDTDLNPYMNFTKQSPVKMSDITVTYNTALCNKIFKNSIYALFFSFY